MNYRNIRIEDIDDILLESESTEKEEVFDKFGCIFKNILFFTGSRDPKENKSLKILLEAIKNIKKHDSKKNINLYVFEVDTVNYRETNGDDYSLTIFDDKEELTLTDESNSDTLVFSRLSVQNSANAVNTIMKLQDLGFLVLNPIRSSKLAMNKYDTAILLEKAEIPQPNFSLVTKFKIDDEKEWNNIRKTIHGKNLTNNKEKNEDLPYVCKILDGHGGTGVFMCKDKQLMAILQTIFAIDPDVELLLQRKEEADGGDIRVHVLTLKDEQIILGAMKRVKLGGDFRSNVSLGATAEKITLTKDQEELALKVAGLSGLPWCAVDIMPLIKGSNKELGDNVILEINSSPGTEGISDVLDENFMNIIISHLKSPRLFDIQEKTSGYKEAIFIRPTEDDEPFQLLATIDTGNGSDSSHFEVESYKINGDTCEFKISGKTYKCKAVDKLSKPTVGDKQHERQVIEVYELKMGARNILNTEIAIVTDRNKSTNALINRSDISAMGYVVSPCKTHILTPEIDKVSILGE